MTVDEPNKLLQAALVIPGYSTDARDCVPPFIQASSANSGVR